MSNDESAMQREAVERLAEAGMKLKWAAGHMDRLEAEISRLPSYEIVKSIDPQTGRLGSHPSPPAVPPYLILIACDAVHNVRVALDYLACAFAIANGKTISGVSFPIASSQSKYLEAQCQGKISKLSKTAQDFVHGLKPYQGGCSLLWALHELDRVDKHQKLVQFDEAPWQRRALGFSNSPAIASQTIRDQPRNFELRLNLAFSGVDIFAGKPALELLRECLNCVQSIVNDARQHF
jgi:hypothetical protein